MASTSQEATNRYVRDFELREAAKPRRVTKDTVYLVHGGPVSNRPQRRAAEAAAKKYGCDPASKTHDKRCPLYSPEA